MYNTICSQMFAPQNTGGAEPAVTTVCVSCIGVNCMSECRLVSGNNPFRINNLVRGANYTISLSLRNSFGQSGESDRMSYGEEKLFLLWTYTAIQCICMPISLWSSLHVPLDG